MRWAAGALLVVAGCSAAPAPPPAPPPPDPVAVCAGGLAYWVGERLKGNTEFEYQAMGLTGDQLKAFYRLLDEAEAMAAPPPGWLDRRATELCREVVAAEAAESPEPGWP
ncbi:hypothetical protein [Actinokineospora sp. NPDC004072]